MRRILLLERKLLLLMLGFLPSLVLSAPAYLYSGQVKSIGLLSADPVEEIADGAFYIEFMGTVIPPLPAGCERLVFDPEKRVTGNNVWPALGDKGVKRSFTAVMSAFINGDSLAVGLHSGGYGGSVNCFVTGYYFAEMAAP